MAHIKRDIEHIFRDSGRIKDLISSKLTEEVQTAFVERKAHLMRISLQNGKMATMKRDRTKASIKVDFEETYDSINWLFLWFGHGTKGFWNYMIKAQYMVVKRILSIVAQLCLIPSWYRMGHLQEPYMAKAQYVSIEASARNLPV